MVVKGTKIATLEVVRVRWISIWLSPRGRLLISPCSCWKSSRTSWQLCFWAMLDAWKMLFSSCRWFSAVFTTRNVTRNIRSFLLWRSCSSFLASAP